MITTDIDNAVDTLKALLRREIDAVECDQIGTLRDSARTKAAISRLVREEMGGLLATLPEQAEQDAAPAIANLRGTFDELIVIAEHHRRVLAGAIDATRERISAVVEARRKAATNHETYGADAIARSGTISRHTMITSSTRI